MPALVNENHGSVNGAGETTNGNGTNSNSPIIDVPVLVVGGGPTGLLLAYQLSQLGGS
jgi:NADPH-dependent 2,4-dienoyl-CoA reductase/sulfur reductase-like enzyme